MAFNESLKKSDKRRVIARGWTSPIAIDLLLLHSGLKALSDVVEAEANRITDARITSSEDPRPRTEFIVPVLDIAKGLGVQVTYGNTDGHPAIVRRSSLSYSIVTGNPAGVQRDFRYLAAHELGHVILRQASGPMVRRSMSSSELRRSLVEEELLATVFALFLLVPRKLLGEVIPASERMTMSVIGRLARLFGVASFTMMRRLALWYERYLVIWGRCLHPVASHSLEELRVLYVFPHIYNVVYKWIPIHATAKDERFRPNLLVDSLATDATVSGTVKVSSFGDYRKQEVEMLVMPIIQDSKQGDLGLINSQSKRDQRFELASWIGGVERVLVSGR